MGGCSPLLLVLWARATSAVFVLSDHVRRLHPHSSPLGFAKKSFAAIGHQGTGHRLRAATGSPRLVTLLIMAGVAATNAAFPSADGAPPSQSFQQPFDSRGEAGRHLNTASNANTQHPAGPPHATGAVGRVLGR